MELTGDPLLDYLEALVLQGIALGIRYPQPLKLPESDVAVRMMISLIRENLLRKGAEPQEFPSDVQDFFFGGPRPEIIG